MLLEFDPAMQEDIRFIKNIELHNHYLII